MTKQEIRAQVKVSIKLMQEAQREAASMNICQQIIATPEWQMAKSVWLYAALPDEVNLSHLIHHAGQCGKQVLLPVIDGERLLIKYYDPLHIVQTGRYNIPEPTECCPTLSNFDEIDLAVIPGRAFTRDGLRLGRGKGYYDRILPSLRCPKWGVAFACQIMEDLPTDPWDVPLDRIFVK